MNRSEHQQMRTAINDVELALNGLEIDSVVRLWEAADDSAMVKLPLGALRQLARCYPELNRIINDPGFERPSWECSARKQGTPGGNDPADCDWPGCGCDPQANKVLEAIDEAGLQITKKPEPLPWDAYGNRYYEPVELLAQKIYERFDYDGPPGTTKPAWTPHGNGTKLDEARTLARKQLRSAGHKPEARSADS